MSDAAPSLLVVSTIAPTIEAFLLPHARHFRSLGWRVDAAASDVTVSDACVAAFDEVHEIEWSRNPFVMGNVSSAVRAVREVVEAERYDIVHVHTPVAAFVTRLALRHMRARAGTRVVYTAHGFHFFEGQTPFAHHGSLALERLAGRWTDRLLVVNREDYEQALRYRLVPPEHVRQIPGVGVETDEWHPGLFPSEHYGNLRLELGIGDAPMFLVVGEFNPAKRQSDVVKALAEWGLEDAHVVFAGEGPAIRACGGLGERLGVRRRMHFLGWRADVSGLMAEADALVHPSLREGLPRVVMEAMSMAKPIVATRIRGNTDLLSDGVGVLVSPGDVSALAAAMRHVMDVPDEVAAMGQRARERVVARYRVELVHAEHEEIYAELLAEKSGDAKR